jgi:hypothetical protein
MRFYDVSVNRSVPTEANRGLTSYTLRVVARLNQMNLVTFRLIQKVLYL